MDSAEARRAYGVVELDLGVVDETEEIRKLDAR